MINIQRGQHRLAVLVAIIVIILTYFSTAVAQQSTDSVQLAISPQVLDTQANPGDTITNVFRLTNGSDIALEILATPKNFTPNGEEGAVDLTEDSTTYSLASWMTATPSKVIVPPKKTVDFNVEIAIPTNAEPGSRFGSVVFSTVPQQQGATGAAVSQEIAPVILVTVAGDTVESAEIVDFYSKKSVWSNESQIVLESRIKNNGNTHFKPKGYVEIKDTFNKVVAKVDLEERNVLPDSIRKIDAVWQDPGFRVGRYTADLTVVYGGNDEIVTSSTSFYIFPYQIILPIVVVIMLIIWVFIRYRKRIMLALKVLSGKTEN